MNAFGDTMVPCFPDCRSSGQKNAFSLIRSDENGPANILLRATILGAVVIGLRCATLLALANLSLSAIQGILSLIFTVLILYSQGTAIQDLLEGRNLNASRCPCAPQSFMNFTAPSPTMPTEPLPKVRRSSKRKRSKRHSKTSGLESDQQDVSSFIKEAKAAIDNASNALHRLEHRADSKPEAKKDGVNEKPNESTAETSKVWKYTLPTSDFDGILNQTRDRDIATNKRLTRALFLSIFAVWIYIKLFQKPSLKSHNNLSWP